MVNYKNAKIYALRSNQTDDVYIGKTCEALSVRFGKHKNHFKHRDTRPYYTAFELLKYEDCYIELVKECPCENVEQLRQFEGQAIREHKCVNKNIAGRTNKEWHEDNKEHRKQYKKDRAEHFREIDREWRKNNQDKVKAYRKIKATCDVCNKIMLRDNLARHKRIHDK
jgi:hypothetical protein